MMKKYDSKMTPVYRESAGDPFGLQIQMGNTGLGGSAPTSRQKGG